MRPLMVPAETVMLRNNRATTRTHPAAAMRVIIIGGVHRLVHNIHLDVPST